MGYLNRVIQLNFPELAGVEEGSGRPIIWITVRNPRLIPGGELVGKGSTIRKEADGAVSVQGAAVDEAYGQFAKLIVGGNVLDPTVDSDDPPPLPMPPSAADMGKYPIEILNAIGKLLADSAPH